MNALSAKPMFGFKWQCIRNLDDNNSVPTNVLQNLNLIVTFVLLNENYLRQKFEGQIPPKMYSSAITIW